MFLFDRLVTCTNGTEQNVPLKIVTPMPYLQMQLIIENGVSLRETSSNEMPNVDQN